MAEKRDLGNERFEERAEDGEAGADYAEGGFDYGPDDGLDSIVGGVDGPVGRADEEDHTRNAGGAGAGILLGEVFLKLLLGFGFCWKKW